MRLRFESGQVWYTRGACMLSATRCRDTQVMQQLLSRQRITECSLQEGY